MAKKTGLSKAAEVEILGPEASDEQQLVKDVNAAISGFVKGVVAFFATAGQFEKKAAASLMAAKTLKAPHDAGSDAVIQRFIQQNADGKKAAAAHWHPIKSTVWGFHRWLCAKEKPTVDAHDAAHALAQPLHNAWVDAERRRVAKKAEDDRLAAEEQARKDRQAELDRLEALAVKAEESSPDLSAREQKFVDQVVSGYPSEAAANNAGFKNVAATGKRLLAMPKITKAIDAALKAKALREQAAAVEQQPLDTVEVVEDKMQIGTAGHDTTRWTGEILDEAATIEAFRNGRHGIPGDLFTINPVKLNEYARSLQKRLDLWPGVRAKKSTRTT